MITRPAVGLIAMAGRRRATLEMAQRLERERFTGLYCPSPGDGLALCEALALSTREIPFGTSIANIYTRHPFDYAQTAAVIHELSGGIAQGAVWANGARSHMAPSLRHLPASARNDPAFFIGNMVPTCIDDDRAAAAAVMRRTLASYVLLPNYQNYW